jgi:protein-disulfide isomerase
MSARRSRRAKRAARGGGRRPGQRTPWVIAAMTAGLALGAVLIVISLTWLGDEDGPGGADQTPVVTGHPCASGSVPVDGRTCGQDSAPVTIVEYSEFLCPFCARAALNTVPVIEEEYVAAGKVRLEFKHFIVHGEEAVLAGGAAECASEQNAFWEYQDLLFANQGALDVPNLRAYAEEVGMDIGEFNDCLDSQRYLDKLAADLEEGRQRGVGGTPTFFVGQTQVVGAQPYSEFKSAIEDELARLGEEGDAE